MITRVRITNYLGLRAATLTFGEGGALLEGDNGRGKSSAIKAIRAALTGQGVDAEAIHKGATEAEIIVDLDHETVRRTITASGARLSITRDDGPKPSAPTKFLADLLGVAPLDPIDLIDCPPKERRAIILRALNVTVTPSALEKWLPPGSIITDADCAGHGLEVVERYRKRFYDERAAAKRALERLESEAQSAEVRAASLPNPAPFGTREDAAQALEEARKAHARLVVERENAGRARVASERTLGRIADLIAQANAHAQTAARGHVLEREAHDAEQLASAAAEVLSEARELTKAARARLAEIEADERAAIQAHADAIDKLRAAQRRADDVQRARDNETAVRQQIADLQASIPEAPSSPVENDILHAAAEIEQCVVWTREFDAREQHAAAVSAHQKAQAEATTTRARVEALDATVRALQIDAPRTLLAACGPGLAGIEIDGDTIKLDGVAIDSLSGAEQLRFAVDIARRLNAKAKLLVIDRLESVSPAQLPSFIEHATADGYQLIAARVGVGDLTVTPIKRSP